MPVVIEDDKRQVVVSTTSGGGGRAEATVPVTRLADVAWLRLRAGGREIPQTIEVRAALQARAK